MLLQGRYVDTLIRAIRQRRALRQGVSEVDEALNRVLKGLTAEIEAGTLGARI